MCIGSYYRGRYPHKQSDEKDEGNIEKKFRHDNCWVEQVRLLSSALDDLSREVFFGIIDKGGVIWSTKNRLFHGASFCVCVC